MGSGLVDPGAIGVMAVGREGWGKGGRDGMMVGGRGRSKGGRERDGVRVGATG